MKNKVIWFFVLTIISILLLASCKNNPNKPQEEDAEMKTKAHFAANLCLRTNTNEGGPVEAYQA